jgi:hypothetical protein
MTQLYSHEHDFAHIAPRVDARAIPDRAAFLRRMGPFRGLHAHSEALATGSRRLIRYQSISEVASLT